MSSCSESLAVIFLFIVLYISIQKTGYSFFFFFFFFFLCFVIIKGVKVFWLVQKLVGLKVLNLKLDLEFGVYQMKKYFGIVILFFAFVVIG